MPNFKIVILTVAIFVVLNLFFNYGVYTFYKPPKFESFCPTELTQKSYSNKGECEAVGGKWFEGSTPVYQGEYYPVPSSVDKGAPSWCDSTATCREGFQKVSSVYNRNVFVILVVSGFMALVIGLFIVKAPAVANGFSGGGILSVIIGSVRYWSDMNDYLRFVILGVALAVLVWIGYKKIKN